MIGANYHGERLRNRLVGALIAQLRLSCIRESVSSTGQCWDSQNRSETQERVPGESSSPDALPVDGTGSDVSASTRRIRCPFLL